MIFQDNPSFLKLNRQFTKSKDVHNKVLKLHAFFLEVCPSLKTALIAADGKIQFISGWSKNEEQGLLDFALHLNYEGQKESAKPLDFSESQYLFLVENNAQIQEVQSLIFVFPKNFELGSSLDFLQSLRWASYTLFQTSQSKQKGGRLSLNTLNKILNNGNSIVSIIDEDWNYRYISPNVSNLLGFPQEVLLGKHVKTGIHPDDYKLIKHAIGNMPVDSMGYELPVYRFLHRPNDHWHYILTHVADYRKDPLIKGYVSTSQDITESYRDRIQIEEDRELFQVVSSTAGDMFYRWNLHTEQWYYQGTTMEDICGFSDLDVQENMSAWWHNRIHPSDREPAIEKQYQALADENIQQVNLLYRFLNSDNEYIWLRETAQIERSDEGVPLRQTGLIRDVTTERNQEIGDWILLNLAAKTRYEGQIAEELNNFCNYVSRICKVHSAEFWMRNKQQDSLNLIAFSGEAAVIRELNEKQSPNLHFQLGEGLPGVAWEQGEIQLWGDLPNHPQFIRRDSVIKAEVQTGMAIPFAQDRHFLGVLVLFSKYGENEMASFQQVFKDIRFRFSRILKDRLLEDEVKQFFTASPDILAISDFQGKIVRVNKAVTKIAGYKPDEIIGKSFYSLIDERDLGTMRNRMVNLLNGEDESSIKIRFLDKEGNSRWILWSSKVRMEDQLIFSVGKDIDSQTQAETQNEVLLKRLKRALAIADLGYWQFFPDNGTIYWSPELYKLYYRDAELPQPQLSDLATFWPPELIQLLEQLKADFPKYHFEEGQSFEVLDRFVYKDETLWYNHNLILKPIYNSQGRIFFEGICQNRTKMEQQMSALAESEKRFKYAIRASNEMIWDWDLRKGTVSRGHYLQNILNYQDKDQGGYDNEWYQIIHPEDRQRVSETLQKKIADGSKDWYQEYRLERKDGAWAYVADRCFILRDANQNAIRCIGSTLDITESRNRLAEIEDKNRRLREIAFQQSHLFRAPLARVKGLIELYNYSETAADKEEVMNFISESIEEMDHVIREIVSNTAEKSL